MPADDHPARGLVFNSVKLPAILAACTIVFALAAFGAIAWRGMLHIEPIDEHLQALTRLQQAGLMLQQLTIKALNGGDISRPKIEALRREVAAISASESFLAPGTPQRLDAAHQALLGFERHPTESLLLAIEPIRKALAAETLAHGKLLRGIRSLLALEFGIAAIAVLALGSFSLLALLRIRRRVIRPLNTLEHLMALLAKRDYSLAPTEGIDPIVRPLTSSYNHLVSRLIELEKENARHRDTLEQEVRVATEAMLEQNRNLATAERLAATGEVAARIAHELRNPVAGMHMALSNIRAECDDRPDIVQRMDLVIDELRRVTGLLNVLLDQSRITPEPAVDIFLAKVVDDLLAIVRYQIPREIALRKNIAEDLVCHLPKDRLRQALLNLILNAANAIGDQNGAIQINASRSNGMLELTVTDDGPGFPDELLTEGIAPFRSGRASGTGLGLSIVSRLVRNLRGEIELGNVEPHGACVRLRLPCRKSHG